MPQTKISLRETVPIFCSLYSEGYESTINVSVYKNVKYENAAKCKAADRLNISKYHGNN